MTSRICRVCQKPEEYLVHEGRRITNFTADGRCASCFFFPERGLEERLRKSVEFNDEVSRITGEKK